MISLILSFAFGFWLLTTIDNTAVKDPIHHSICVMSGILYLVDGLFRLINILFFKEIAQEIGIYDQVIFMKEMLTGTCIILSIFAVLIINKAKDSADVNKGIYITAGILVFAYVIILLLLNPELFGHSVNREIFILAYKSKATVFGAGLAMSIAAFCIWEKNNKLKRTNR